MFRLVGGQAGRQSRKGGQQCQDPKVSTGWSPGMTLKDGV